MPRLRTIGNTIAILILFTGLLSSLLPRASARSMAASATVVANPTEYTITDLGDLGNNNHYSQAFAINNAGQVVGETSDASGYQRPFLYSNGQMSLLASGGPSNSYASAWGINNSGQAVGRANNFFRTGNTYTGSTSYSYYWSGYYYYYSISPSTYTTYDSRAMIFDGNNPTDLGVLGYYTSSYTATGYYYWYDYYYQNWYYQGSCCGSFPVTNTYGNSYAYDINDAGQVVGESTYSGGNGNNHAFIYNPGSGMTDLGTLGGSYSNAWGINNSGHVAGYSVNSAGYGHAFLWDGSGPMQDLGTLPGGSWSYGYDINDSDKVVGTSGNSSGNNHAFIYDSTNGMQDLGTLGGSYSEAFGINNSGKVVGWSYLPNYEQRAFVYDATSGMQDLNSLLPAGSGWTLYYARDINDSGQIVGYGVHNGYGHAFLMTPVSNTAPTAVADNYTTDEDTALTVTTSNGTLSNDSDPENDTLNASLVSPPSHSNGGFALNTDGTFSYTPAANFYGTDSFTYKANDGQADSEEMTVTITVGSVNDTPTLNAINNQSVDELTPLVLDQPVSGSDVDTSDPTPDVLTYSLSFAPVGATIDPVSGAISWTPTEAQGGSVDSPYSFTARLTDSHDVFAEQSFQVNVNEINLPPTLSGVPASVTIDELVLHTFTATGSDPDLPSNSLAFSLEGAPAGASIDPTTGVFQWTPSEAQGTGGSYTFTVRLTDNGSPSRTDDETIIVSVSEVNTAPVLATIGAQSVNEMTELTFTASAGDSDIPANGLSFSLVNAPDGATIDSATGALHWTPTEEQGGNPNSTHTFTVKVTDNGTPALSDEEEIIVTVNEVNREPVLEAVGNKTVDEMTPLTFTATATDPDKPDNTLTFSLLNAPSGASIDPSSGVFTWTPTETQGGNPNSTHTFTVKVTDDGAPTLADEEQITVTVNEINRAPSLTLPLTNASLHWGNVLTFNASATDPDVPANTLTYSLASGAPSGAAIDPITGAFSWTPTAAQVSTTAYSITVVVIDNGITRSASDPLSDSKSITVLVTRRPTAISYTGDGSEQYSDQQALSALLVDAGGGAMNGQLLALKAIGFAIGSQSVGATTNGSGVGANTLILTQDPAPGYNVVSSFAGDTAYGPSSDADAFDITQEDARATYTGTSYAIADNAGKVTLTFSATIKDISAPEFASDPTYDLFPGDIRNAKVDFVNRDAGNLVLCSPNVGLVNPFDAQVGTATCNYAVNIGSADAQSFTIGIVVRNYYGRNESDDNSIVQVSKAVPGLITGGGYLLMFNPTRSAGLYPGATNTKTNFGFNIKNDSKANAPKGNINVIIRNGGRVFQIKGNAMTSLGTDMKITNNHPFPTATFNGKASIQDITNPLNVISIDGNCTLQVTLTDKGNDGDAIAITVWNKAGGLWYASNWNGTKTIEQLLGGGNLVVR